MKYILVLFAVLLFVSVKGYWTDDEDDGYGDDDGYNDWDDWDNGGDWDDEEEDVECGKPAVGGRRAARIVGGKPAKPKAWPWQASIQSRRQESHTCGGTVIAKRWILTAAHCIPRLIEDPYSSIIRLGSNDLTKGGEDFEVDKAIAHPDYNRNMDNDVALIKLKEPIEYSDEIKPVCLPNSDKREVEKTGIKMTATGFGDTISGGDVYKDYMMQVDLKTIDWRKCSRQHGGLQRSQFCAGAPGKDTCQGDGGGPLQKKKGSEWYQYGVVSFGGTEKDPCANARAPGVYVRVSKYCDWIEEETRLSLCK